MKYFVTGGTGSIGGRVARSLVLRLAPREAAYYWAHGRHGCGTHPRRGEGRAGETYIIAGPGCALT